MRYLLDEDLPTSAAVIARELDLDAVNIHELNRRGLSDAEQFGFALREGRITVTRNRDDFLRLVVGAFQAGAPSPGVLVVPRSIRNGNAPAIAQALARWDKEHQIPGGPGLCIFDYIG